MIRPQPGARMKSGLAAFRKVRHELRAFSGGFPQHDLGTN
jgi:hypothetical protein